MRNSAVCGVPESCGLQVIFGFYSVDFERYFWKIPFKIDTIKSENLEGKTPMPALTMRNEKKRKEFGSINSSNTSRLVSHKKFPNKHSSSSSLKRNFAP